MYTVHSYVLFVLKLLRKKYHKWVNWTCPSKNLLSFLFLNKNLICRFLTVYKLYYYEYDCHFDCHCHYFFKIKTNIIISNQKPSRPFLPGMRLWLQNFSRSCPGSTVLLKIDLLDSILFGCQRNWEDFVIHCKKK